MTSVEPTLVVVAALLLCGVAASKASARLGVPALLLFLVIGMLAGSEGPGGIEFDDFEAAQSIGVVALAYILFAGGLDTRWSDVRPAAGAGLSLATIGVVVTAAVAGFGATLLLDLTLTEGLLLGAIVSSTDAAAVFSVLRSSRVGLRGHVRPLLELESGSNDPMAVFLTLALLEVLVGDASVGALVLVFVLQVAVGAAVGWFGARAAVLAVNRSRLEYDGLYPVLTIAIVALVYGSTVMLGGSGFLAVYVAGLAMARTGFLHQGSLVRFHDALAWLLQVTMFLVLGLLVFPSELVPVAGAALGVSLVLVLVARPLGVLAALATSRFSVRERSYVAWVGLRGAVPIVLATFPEVEGVAAADTIFNVVFFVVLTSVLLQGTTIPVVARWLRVNAPPPSERTFTFDFVGSSPRGRALHELVVAHHSVAAHRGIVDLGLPAGALLVLVSPGGDHLVPQGTTVLEPGDRVLVLADHDGLVALRALVASPTPGHGEDTDRDPE